MKITPEILAAVDNEVERILTLRDNRGRDWLTRELAMAIEGAGNVGIPYSALWHKVLPFLREMDTAKAKRLYNMWSKTWWYDWQQEPEPLKPVGVLPRKRNSRKG